MKVQTLISAGFAITALAAASVPAVGWTLLGDAAVEPPAAVSVQTWEAPPVLLADASMQQPVAFRTRLADPSDRARDE